MNAAREERFEPLPPQNLEAEESVLGAMMLTRRAVEAVEPILQPRDFYRESHGRIYAAALALHHAGTAVDWITVATELTRRGQLMSIEGGEERIREIALLVPAAANAAHHARIVADLASLREAIAVGHKISRMALDMQGSDADTVRTAALELVQGLQERTGRNPLELETWRQFEESAHDQIPTLIDGLWVEAAFGFIAAPPKKGKTWLGIAMAVAIAAGQPFLGFKVPAAKPVVYLALEGHRAALRARIGAIARGYGLDPDSDALDNLHMLYKPRGMNLADPTWARHILNTTQQVKASILFVDVLRAAARIKENDQAEFGALRFNLQPITDAGVSIAMLHHFIKLSETSKERDPGERMAGSGSMYGALDAGIYIIGSEDNAKKLKISFDGRDGMAPEPMSVELAGKGTSDHGGFTYRDSATFEVTDRTIPEDDLEAAPEAIVEWLQQQPERTASTTEIAYFFEVSDRTVKRRSHRLNQLGVKITERAGRSTLYQAPDTEDHDQQIDISSISNGPDNDPGHTQDTPRTTTLDNAADDEVSRVQTSEQAKNADPGHTLDNEACPTPEMAQTQGKQEVGTLDSSTRSERPPAGAHAPARVGTRTREAETWIRDEGWMHPQPLEALIEKYPTLHPTDYENLAALARRLALPDDPIEGLDAMDGEA